jgi:nickel/cobalt transporter (NiCoT) family protein
VLSDRLGWQGAFFEFLNQRLDFGLIGYLIVGLFLGAWLSSVVLWRVRRIDERYGDRLARAES